MVVMINVPQTTSLGNAMAHLGIDMATSVAWRERLINPDRFLKPDPRLRKSLVRLRTFGLRMVALTNNPRSVGEATLKALGVADLFIRVVGLDDTLKSKPAREPFLLAASYALDLEIEAADTVRQLPGMEAADMARQPPGTEAADTVLQPPGIEAASGYSVCLAVGDRYDVDLAIPLELGMGAVLVDGVEDVYGLQDLLNLT